MGCFRLPYSVLATDTEKGGQVVEARRSADEIEKSHSQALQADLGVHQLQSLLTSIRSRHLLSVMFFFLVGNVLARFSIFSPPPQGASLEGLAVEEQAMPELKSLSASVRELATSRMQEARELRERQRERQRLRRDEQRSQTSQILAIAGILLIPAVLLLGIFSLDLEVAIFCSSFCHFSLILKLVSRLQPSVLVTVFSVWGLVTLYLWLPICVFGRHGARRSLLLQVE